MDDFLNRQFSLIRRAIVDYQGGMLSLNAFVHRVEAIGKVINGNFWDERLFPIVVDLERINSEIIDQGRHATLSENERIKHLLSQLDAISDQQELTMSNLINERDKI